MIAETMMYGGWNMGSELRRALKKLYAERDRLDDEKTMINIELKDVNNKIRLLQNVLYKSDIARKVREIKAANR